MTFAILDQNLTLWLWGSFMKRILISVFIGLFGVVFGQIIETTDIFEINNHLDEGTLLVYDLDNTLIEPVQMLGSDQWFYHRWMQLKNELPCQERALARALSEWMAIQSFTGVKEVQPGTSKLIKEQQAKRVPMIGLTTRDIFLAACTVGQLGSLGIDLSETAPHDKEFYFLNDCGKSVLFKKGVLFTSNSHKGKAFMKFLQEAKWSPKKVVFINDKKTHLAQLEESCEEAAIAFVGLRYGFLDEKVASFDTTIADIQVAHFGLILSDEEARKKLKTAREGT